MSYDVLLQRFQHGEAVPVESPAVWRLLEEAWDAPPDEFNHCLVRRGEDEGDLYAVQAGGPIDGLLFNHVGPEVYELMYELAAAGDMVIIPPDIGPFLVRDEQREHLPDDLSVRAVLVRSGPELVGAIGEA